MPISGITSFTAHWKAVPDADGYDVAIYTRTHDAHGKTGTGFDNFTTSSPNLPEGWSITPKQGRNDNTYGQAAPSIRLRADSASLVVAVPGNRLSIVSDTIGVDTTGVIDAIRALPFAANDVAIYDLQGRLVTTLPNGTNAAAVLPKGIYIAGGRKFVVK